jgi:hypothetical protein
MIASDSLATRGVTEVFGVPRFVKIACEAFAWIESSANLSNAFSRVSDACGNRPATGPSWPK